MGVIHRYSLSGAIRQKALVLAGMAGRPVRGAVTRRYKSKGELREIHQPERPEYYLSKAVRAQVEAAHASTPERAQSWLEMATLYRVMAASAVRAERPKAPLESSDADE